MNRDQSSPSDAAHDHTIWLEDTPATYVLLDLLAEAEAYLAEQDRAETQNGG